MRPIENSRWVFLVGAIILLIVLSGLAIADPIIISSSSSTAFGTGSNYTEFEEDGTMIFRGDATVWDDLRVPLSQGKISGGNVPAWEQMKDNGAASTGVYAYNFDDGDEIWFSAQLPHGWMTETTIYPHIHWLSETDASGDNVGLGLECNWTDIGATMGNTALYAEDEAGSTAFLHLLDNVPDAGFSGAGHGGISSIINCRVYRYAAASDNYTGGIFILEVDFHIELDMIGSHDTTSK